MNFKMKNGITIVSLVVTIVILIILSGVTAYNLLGDDGLLSTSRSEKTNIDELQETTETRIREMENTLASDAPILETPIGITVSKKAFSGTSSISISANASQNAGFDVTYHVELYRKGENTPISTTAPSQIASGSTISFKAENLSNNTEYEYKIILTSSQGEEVVETGEIALKPVATAGEASQNESNWTNQDVIVTLPTLEGFTTKYQVGNTLNENGTWNTYNSNTKVTVTENQTIWYRYSDGTNSGEANSIEIENIDKVLPVLSSGGWLYGDVDLDGDVDSDDYDLIRDVNAGNAQLHSEIAKIQADVDGDGSVVSKDATYIGRYINGTLEHFDAESIALTSYNATTNSLKARLCAIDTLSGLNKVKWYYKKTSDENYTIKEETLENSTNQELLETTLTGLDRGAAYTVYAEVLDVAGNIATSNEVSKNTRTGAYQIAFNGNGADEGSIANMNMSYGVPQTLTANTFLKIGYTFTGWNTLANGTGTTYTNAQSVDILTEEDGQTITLYAQWELAKVYAKLFDVDGNGTGETLVFGSKPDFTYSVNGVAKTMITNYGEVTDTQNTRPTWSSTSSTANAITTVDFVDVVWPKSMFQWFRGLTNLTQINNISKLKTNLVRRMDDMFSGCSSLTTLDVSNFNTENVTNMGNMFNGCNKLTVIDVSGFDTSKVTTMAYMFFNCSHLEELDVSNFITDNVNMMTDMFLGCSSLEELDVSNFNTEKVRDMAHMFNGCSSLTELDLDEFNTEKVTQMHSMFQDCSSLTELDVSSFNTDLVTTMHSMFQGCSGVTELDLSNFNTELVGSMASMFWGCTNLEELDISSFNTEAVTTMYGMFRGCSSLTELDLSNFNTPLLENISEMFRDCIALEELDISNLDTDIVSNMRRMFFGCRSLTSLDVSGFDTSTATDMYSMFEGCQSLTTLDISSFNTENVQYMNEMFEYCTNLTTIYVGDNWTTEAVTESTNMFQLDTALVGGDGTVYNSSKIDKEYARIDNLPGTPGYFTDASIYTVVFDANTGTGTMANQRLKKEVASNLSANTFIKTGYSFTGWNTVAGGTGTSYTDEQSVTDIAQPKQTLTLYAQWERVKAYAKLFDVDGDTVGETLVFGSSSDFTYSVNDVPATLITSYGEVTNTNWVRPTWGSTSSTATAITTVDFVDAIYPQSAHQWFYGLTNLTQIKNISRLKTDLVTNMGQMFKSCSNIQTIDVTGFNTENVLYMNSMFEGCSKLEEIDLSNFSNENVENMSSMFWGCQALTEIDFTGFGTENVNNMGNMFRNCSSLEELDLSSFNTDLVEGMACMFYGCGNLTSLDISSFNTENVTNMQSMFWGCSKLEELDVSDFNTENVENMGGMFRGCNTLTVLDVSNFNTEKVNDMSQMFWGCNNVLTLDVSDFNTEEVTKMDGMFAGCNKVTVLDVSNFNTEKVQNMNGMFDNCHSITTLNLSNFNTDLVSNIASMFYNCRSLETLDVSNFNTELVESMANMFYGCNALTQLDLSSFNTSRVNTMEKMFMGDNNLTILDLSSFNTSLVTNMGSMFQSCNQLTTIFAGNNWTTTAVTNSGQMFYNNTSLVGGEGTPFSGSKTDKEYARIDSLPDTPGYFTDVSSTYRVVFNSNGGTGTMAAQRMRVGVAQNLKTNTFTKGGCVFAGWNTADDGTGTSYFDGDPVTDLALQGQTITLYAQWATAGAYAKLFDVDGNGTGETLVFGMTSDFTYSVNGVAATLKTNYGDVSNTPSSKPAWVSATATANAITTVDFVSVICPRNIAYWFNNLQYLTEIKHIERLKTDFVIDLHDTFSGCTRLPSVDVTGFNTENVTNLTGMFWNCYLLTEIDVSSFNTENVTNMDGIFGGCKGLLELDLSSWNTIKVTNMPNLFQNCTVLTKITFGSNFTTAKVTNMNNMFSNCNALTDLDVSSFNTEKVTGMSSMFNGCKVLTEIDLSNFNTVRVTNMVNMFNGCNNVEELDVSNFNTSLVTSMQNMFSGCNKVEELDVSDFNTSKVTNMLSMFNGCNKVVELDVSGFDTSKVTTMANMFTNCYAVEDLDVSSWDTSNVTNMSAMFQNCSAVTEIDASSFDTSKVTTMANMFNGCTNLETLDVSNFNTEIVDTMQAMFNKCNKLTELDLSSFDTKMVTNMQSMFNECYLLDTLDISSFDTSNVINMSSMFTNCKVLATIDVSGFNTEKVTNMSAMFRNCWELTELDLSSFNTSIVTNMNSMFQECKKLTTIYVSDGFVVTGVTSSTSMFNTCSLIEGGSGTTYDGSKIDKTYAKIDRGGSNKGYFTRGYTVNFDANGGTGTMKHDLYKAGETKTLSPNTFKRIGYTFAGWNTAPDGTGASFTDEQSITLSSIDNMITLYAQWTKAPVLVFFDANEGEFENSALENIVEFTGTAETITLTSKTANVSADGTSFSGEYGNNVNTVDILKIPGAKTINVSIDFQTQGNSYDYVCIYDKTIAPTAANYLYCAGGAKLGATTKTHKDFILPGDTAQILFVSNANNNNYFGYYAVIEGEGITLEEETGMYEEPTRSGYTFAGWSLDQEGEQMIELTDIYEDTLVYAQWK